MGLAIAVVAALPHAAWADQYRSNHWIYGSIEREFFNYLSGQDQFGQGGTSSIGEPNSDELVAGSDGRGRWQAFGFDTNRIYWSPDVDANRGRQVGGLIMAKWLNLPPLRNAQGQITEVRADERGRLGYPTTAESQAQGGRYNNFQGGAITYEYGALAAYADWGDIRNQWAQTGYETGPLKFPTSDELQCSANGRVNATYGGSGQTFSGSKDGKKFLVSASDPTTYTTDGESKGVVLTLSTGGRELRYGGTTKYTTELNAAVTMWNNESGRVTTRRDDTFPKIIIGEDSVPGGTWDGRTNTTMGTLRLNTANLDTRSSAYRQHVIAHEMGHAQGLAHDCTTQLMDPVSSTVNHLGVIDQYAYRTLYPNP